MSGFAVSPNENYLTLYEIQILLTSTSRVVMVIKDVLSDGNDDDESPFQEKVGEIKWTKTKFSRPLQTGE